MQKTSHIQHLYEHDTEGSGFTLVPKLKYEHVYMSSFSKIRVDLSAHCNKLMINLLGNE